MENAQESQLLQDYRTCMSRLQVLWDEIGFNVADRTARIEFVVDQVKKLFMDMIAKESAYKKKLLSDIDKNGHQFFILNKELDAGIRDPDDNLTLIDLDKYLRHNVEAMLKESRKRKAHLNELQKKEQELCERLIEEPTEISEKSAPCKEDIDMLERRIRTLEQEKVNREKTFHYLQDRISELMEELEQKANCSFERDALSDVELFTLSQQNLQRMKELKEECDKKVKANKAESVNLRNQINLLWNRLEVDPLEREIFLTTAEGHSPSSLLKLSEELNRLKQNLKQDMAKYINKLRRELEDLWEKCYISDEEKTDFTSYFTDDYSEEVLTAHDNEIQKLHQHYVECKVIYDKLEQRQRIWLKFMDLEERASNPNRLFGNRGCALLQEEKERKKVKKELPIVEKELENLVQVWESEHGKRFMIEGRSVREFIENEWLKHHERKEQEKKKKQSERVSQLNYESRMGAKPPPVKRRIAASETLRKSKLQRISEDQPSYISSVVKKSALRRTVLRERNQNSIREGSEQSASEISTYSRFADGIQRRSERENMRSSVVQGIIKTPTSIPRPSSHRPPSGISRTPKTLPRAPSRCSPRLNGTRSARRASRNMTASRITFSPASSPLFRSPRVGSTSSATPSKWNKLTFLI